MKILIAAGGSGGHIFPAVALARELLDKRRDVDILFVASDKTLDRRIFEKEGFRSALLSANKLPYRVGFGMLAFLIKFVFDFAKAFFIIISYRPDVAVGFGGYVACPVMVISSLLRIPTVVHEQNVVPGRANLFLFRLADKIAISFEETRKFLGPNNSNAVFTGNPIRLAMLKDDKEKGIEVFGLSKDRFTILVVGGSQGAHFLNETFVGALRGLDESARRSLQIIHITGVKDYEPVSSEYKKLNIDHRVYSFIDRIEEAYSASDLVVTRSGASAIFEIALYGRPMVLVPYPFAKAHQIENAKAFADKGAAVEIEERGLSAEAFRDKILGLLASRQTLREMGDKAKSLSVPHSSEMLAEAVLNYARS